MNIITPLTGTDTFDTWFNKTNQIIDKLNNGVVASVKHYGAFGDGGANDTSAIQDALDSGYQAIYFPAGTYKITTTLTIPQNVSIFGDGPDSTIIDARQVVTEPDTQCAIRTAVGTWTSMGITLASTGVTLGSQNINFFTAHGLTGNDVFLIWNPSNYSWSNFVSYHRAGEIQRVAIVPNTTSVRLQGSAYDNYNSSDIVLYKLTSSTSCSIKNLSIKLSGSNTTSNRGIRVRNGINCILENVKVTGAPYAGIELQQCHNVLVNNCWVQEDGQNNFGGDYGLAIYNCSSVLVNGGYYSASRHAITIGGGSDIGGVPNRFIKIIGANCHSSGDADGTPNGALDVHPNCEHVLFRNCTVDGGIAGIGGDNITVQGCHILGRGAGDTLLYGAGCKGTNFVIHNNHFVSTRKGRFNRGAFIDFGAQNDAISHKTSKGGIISIKNNTFDWQHTATTSKRREAGELGSDGYSLYGNWLSIVNSGITGYTGGDIIIDIQGNTVKAPNHYHQGGAYIEVNGKTFGSQFNVINFSNNTCVNVGGPEIGSSWISANSVIIQGNNIVNSGNLGIQATHVKDSIICKGNNVSSTRSSPAVYLRGKGSSWLDWSTGLCDYIEVSENTVNNGVLTRDYTASNGSLTDYSIFHFNRGVFRDNTMGYNTQAFITDSNPGFVLNETITGNSSNATAIIKAFRGVTQFGIGVTNSNGIFTVGEIITGNVSGKTTTLTGITSTHKYGAFVYTGNELWSGKNAWWSGFTLTLSGITTNNIL